MAAQLTPALDDARFVLVPARKDGAAADVSRSREPFEGGDVTDACLRR